MTNSAEPRGRSSAVRRLAEWPAGLIRAMYGIRSGAGPPTLQRRTSREPVRPAEPAPGERSQFPALTR
jgi:hypothetical protein